MNPVELKYNKEHEYAKVEGNIVTFGITDHAQESLGDVVFVELPDVGTTVTAGKSYGTVESVKAVSDITASVSGKVVEVNTQVMDSPDLLNSEPYGEGWLIKVEADDLSSLDGLMTAAEYEAFLAQEEH
ncbi:MULTISPECIES: glycine cleavage system protein GcvH [Desulfosporosinus]|uniref:Glycine cleavage system H protein n=1 Tax=Desulfosporosinus nitroreducens TaxID=2018668 RepID=A0ABT8QNQ0_9FIRM|nr:MULTISPECIES: glycine cleavage system protein GcvH [Desulfosporosinus]MCO1601217.1 glycine cleavage system protein GcvH [Desulfosporosinus nitroreducens]MCO5385529.1 glycine cleavage system protein GcvH [Desulfosporosinus sp.]MDA8223824.1 glycine cleavage system protein GcvH [Desulfitobacterium hafniense]MDO0821718.1 glycine cleavage system protein GcvH [Desulfosporosinus nitroreducens]